MRATWRSLVLALLLVGPATGWADPFAEEGFEDYAPGSIAGGAGGAGFGAAWQGSSVEEVVDTTSDPLVYQTTDGEAIAGGDRALSMTGNQDYAAVRDLVGTRNDSDVYVSMLMRFVGVQKDNDFLALWLEEAGFGAAPNIGVKMNGGGGATGDFFVRTQAGNHVAVVDLVPGQTYFLVGHLSRSTPGDAYDSFRIWVDPVTLYAEPADDGVSSGVSNISSFGRIGFRTANLGGGDRVVVDRLRLGSSWRDVASPDLHPVLDVPMNETHWNGSAGEVTDAAAGIGGTALGGADTAGTDPAVPGDPGTCRYAQLDGSDDYLAFADAPRFDLSDELTVSIWIYARTVGPELKSIVSKDTNYEFHLDNAGRVFWWWNDTDGNVRSFTTTGAVGLNAWHHVAITYASGSQVIYVDGVAAASTSYTGTLVNNDLPLQVGQDQGYGGRFWNGRLDELQIYDRALTATEVQAVMSQTRPCGIAGAAGFVINHDGAGIHCLDEPVTVSAVDAGSALVPGYVGRITLDTGTGRGGWSLLSGAGAFADASTDDGLASYVFDPADGGRATFALSYPQGPPVLDVDAYQSYDTTIRDTDAEGPLTFAPSGFTVTASALPNPPPSPIADPIPTQIAGTGFPLHVTAYGVTDDDPQCGVIESYTGSHDLTFTTSYVNPASGSIAATVDDLPTGSGAAQPVSFSAGQAMVTARYKDVGSIRLSLEDVTSSPDTLSGGSDAFVVQPAALVVSRVATAAGSANPGAVGATGPAFAAAGEAFELDVEARDADGDRTPNFGLETPPESVQIALSTIVVPSSGGVGNLMNASAFAASAVPGRFTATSVAFDDVGVIRLQPALADGDYLGSGPVPGTVSGPVGRFHPAAFDLASAAVAPGCGTFTYMDQPTLSLQYRLQALNVAGNVTRNYDVALLGSPAAVAGVGLTAESADDGTDLGARLTTVGGGWTSGEMIVDRPDLAFARASVPDGPFDTLQLAVTVVDPLDAVPLSALDAGPTTSGDCVAAGDCSARSLGGPTRVVYGRLAVLPIAGPENEDLKLPLAAQIFTGSAFERNPADACSVYSAARLSLAGYSGNLSAGETSVLAPLGAATLSAGAADAANPPTLSAPGFGNDGSVDVTLDVDPWLEFDWLGGGDTDPTATASFGHFRGHDRIIFWGEPD